MEIASWSDFEKILLCAGTILRIEAFPEARKPAWKLWVDFGPYGVRKTSTQIRDLYWGTDLTGKRIADMINFAPKQAGSFTSEFLLTGFPTEHGVAITTLEREVPNGLNP
ncbi:MAG: tRNA-binding protein [Xanthomonadaceae bacterium]|jgi:tRNA-binding protein|nr:tRNA-binding protein [Xanthomonadaceae bacterium]